MQAETACTTDRLVNDTRPPEVLLEEARGLEAAGQLEAATAAYLQVLRVDSGNYSALCELGALALSTGHRAAAQTAYQRAVQLQPHNPAGRVNLGNLYYQEGELQRAQEQYEAALQSDSEYVLAHQGLACTLEQLGELQGAKRHWQRGFVGHAVAPQRYRGSGAPIRVLLLVSTRLGNVATAQFLDDRTFAVTAIYADAFNAQEPLPAHDVIFNAIGDADLCGATLQQLQVLLDRTDSRIINPPSRVIVTDRLQNARRLGRIEGVIAPDIRRFGSAASAESVHDLRFPVLMRAPGFHMGKHFTRVERAADLPMALAALPAGELLAIEFLDARGVDGMTRKYRVMFIDGVLFPLHLAVAKDWKVHYFSAAMADSAVLRAEEQRFLEDMPAALGARAMRALAQVCRELDLDYAGIDFGLAPEGSILLFEANATMAILPPGPDTIWDYRRQPIDAALQAARRLVLTRAANT
jgi:tetratricopeptide (TPR) repeat protein